MALIVYGLFPADVQARVSWGSWFLAALPAQLVLFGLTMAFLLWRYRPERDEALPEQTLAVQQRLLGGFSRDEWSALAVLVLLLLGFCTQSIHRVDPAWIAVAAVGLLFLAGSLDESTFSGGINLSLLLYLGVILGFGTVFEQVHLDEWLSHNLESVGTLAGGSATLFLMLVGVVTVLVTMLLRPGPISVILALALFPNAAALKIDPWVVAFTALMANNLWLYPQQNAMYLAAYYGSAERAFTHAQARPLAIAFTAFIFIAVLVSIPYWRWLGLIG